MPSAHQSTGLPASRGEQTRHSPTVTLPQDHFGRDVLGRATELLVEELLLVLHLDDALVDERRPVHQAHLGEAEVGELDVPHG